MNANASAAGTSGQQNAETDKLADDGGPGRAGNPHFESKNQKRIQGDIQNSAAGDTEHAVKGVTLKTELIV